MSKSSNVVYLLTTDDKYELPFGVYDSVPEMARALGRDPCVLHGNVSKALHGKEGRNGIRVNGKSLRVFKIDIGGDGD